MPLPNTTKLLAETTTTTTSSSDTPPPMRNHDGTFMLNEHGQVVYRSQFLSTHPLRKDCMERLASNGMKLTYMTGDGVIRTMNAAFGNTGWSTEITRERQVVNEVNRQGRFVVGYLATVRVSLDGGTTHHEDCGTGECTHDSKLKAIDIAFKAAVTDAMKRAARHFGERLGNALYVKGNGLRVAPKDNMTALAMLEMSEANDMFGDQKKRHTADSKGPSPSSGKTGPLVTVGASISGNHQEHNHASPVTGYTHSTTTSYTTPILPGSRITTPMANLKAGFNPHDTFVTPQETVGRQVVRKPTVNAGSLHHPAGTDTSPVVPPSTQTFSQSRFPRASPSSSATSPGLMHRPVSADGPRPTSPQMPRPTSLEDATNRTSPQSWKRSGETAPVAEAKRVKTTRNPYGRQ